MIDRFLNQTLTVKTIASTNKYGEYTYTSTTIKARIELISKIIRFDNGELKTLRGRLYSKTLLNVGDVIVYNSVEYKIYNTKDNRDGNGIMIFYKYSLE